MVVLDLRLDLVNGSPSNVANLDVLLPEELLRLVRLDPDLVQALGVGQPGLASPLRVGNPDVLGGVDEEAGVDDLNEEVDLRLRALRIEVRDVPNLDILPEDMGNHAVENLNILGDTCALAMIADEVDSHLV